jgi:Uma2 family endonuclease
MPTLLLDPLLEEQLLEERRAWGADHHDEVWDGVYRMTPLPHDDHQDLVSSFDTIFRIAIAWQNRGLVRAGVNISDRVDDWTKNYRCPDVVVFLKETKAKNYGTFWLGGPDFLVEVASPGDETRAKIPFYARVSTREMLIVERDPWILELFRLHGDSLVSVGVSDLASQQVLTSQVLPFSFRLVDDLPRPRIEIKSTETGQAWLA